MQLADREYTEPVWFNLVLVIWWLLEMKIYFWFGSVDDTNTEVFIEEEILFLQTSSHPSLYRLFRYTFQPKTVLISLP